MNEFNNINTQTSTDAQAKNSDNPFVKPSSHPSSIKLLFIILLLAILTTTLVYLYGQQQNDHLESITTTTPTPAPTPTASPTPTTVPTIAAEELKSFFTEPTVAASEENNELGAIGALFDEAEFSNLDEAPQIDLDL
ncbi:hypothetical protein B5M47_00895 [candidate division CPR3 bacterium 4484_211]|uniref:Uncharacterized protein n=1 Tax=candidate division CPR3 bacterium 4484_211 TaxID=1968527 RepID=A0A1W9NZ37_UNCC3|nr:MAG: hypothetical protein B5M47_00895 [candidate division CPR3 bacterium 4484_211]